VANNFLVLRPTIQLHKYIPKVQSNYPDIVKMKRKGENKREYKKKKEIDKK